MKRIFLTISALSLMLGASAASKRLTTITEKSYGESYVTAFTYDDSGRLTKIDDSWSAYTFDYSQVAAKKLTLTRVDQEETIVYEMTLNDEGLVEKVLEYDDGALDEDYYTFEYTDGRLTNYKQVRPDEVEESRISYDSNGAVTKIENIDGSPTESETITFEYDGIANQGNLSLWDNLFSVDLDDMEYAAMAGFMGKAPAQLPVKSTCTDSYGSESDFYEWAVDADGYASSLTVKDEYNTEVYEFAWKSNVSGVHSVAADASGASRFFSADGIELDSSAKGIVIERKADGSTVKHIRK